MMKMKLRVRCPLGISRSRSCEWSQERSTEGRLRITSFAEANDRLYATVGQQIYERTDGQAPNWRLIYTNSSPGRSQSGLRGLTAVPSPDDGHGQVLLAGVEGTEPRIVRIDPRNGSETTDLDLHDFLDKAWGMVTGYMTAAYNDMAEVRDGHGDDVFLIGLEALIPRYSQVSPGHRLVDIGKGRLEGNAWYLIRSLDGTYKLRRIPARPGQPMVATRDRSWPRHFRPTAMQSISPGSMPTKPPRTIRRGSFAPPLTRRSAVCISCAARLQLGWTVLMDSFLAFFSVSVIVIVTPGPDTAVTIRNTLIGGRSGGVLTALGIAGGQTIWAVATSIGIVTLLVASAPLFLTVKYAGAAYLAFLGAQSLREAVWPGVALARDNRPRRKSRLTRPTAFRQGLVSDLGNPKMAIFFASLLPQFVPAGEAAFWVLLRLGAVFAVMTFAWLALYAAVVARAGDILRRPSLRRGIEAVTGTVLIGLGLSIATERR